MPCIRWVSYELIFYSKFLGWTSLVINIYAAVISGYSGHQLSQCWLTLHPDRKGTHGKPYNQLAAAAFGPVMGWVGGEKCGEEHEQTLKQVGRCFMILWLEKDENVFNSRID